MKKSELDRILQKVPAHPSPSPSLEQYLTPAPVAADALFFAAQHGDIIDQRVGDLGCGTGILAVGAMLLGAAEVVAIDIDDGSVEVGRKFADGMGLEIDWRVGDIKELHDELDTVVMNPPFGAQRQGRHADRAFLEKAFECARVVYSFHMASTWLFVEREAQAAGFTVTHKNKYEFSIKHMFDFHRKERQDIDVLLFRMASGG